MRNGHANNLQLPTDRIGVGELGEDGPPGVIIPEPGGRIHLSGSVPLL